MSIRPLTGLIALSMAGAAQPLAAQSVTPAETAISPGMLLVAMALLAVAGCALVLVALRERRREQAVQAQPVRLRQTVRRYTQP